VRHAPAIAAREVRSLFSTPVAYVTLAAYLLILGYFFFVGLGVMMQQIQQIEAMQMFDLLAQFNLNERVIAPAYGTASIILVFVVPLLTMGVFAEERRQGTLELLLTSPLTVWEIVIGKYAGVLAFVAVIVALSAVFPVFLFAYGDPEFWQVAANLLGLFCAGAAIAAFGCFASALTRSTVVAAVIGILGSLFLWLIGLAGQIAPPSSARAVLEYLGTMQHFDSMLQGLVRLQDLVYFVVVVGFFLVLVRAIIESLRLR
jgi:ABC-2 type transport system permease protein